METHNIEWKKNWQDEWLKWICGFANANGGTIEIGKDDNGNVVPLKDTKKLLIDIPNKIIQSMGIYCDVNLTKENTIIIKVKQYSNPISYHGKFYFRSGGTNQELNGFSLEKFLLEKQGNSWDSVFIDDYTIDDLSDEAFAYFRRRAISSERLSKEDVDSMNNLELLESLGLAKDGKLTRAAYLLFAKNPEKLVLNTTIKVAYFIDEADFLYQDEVKGPLISIVNRTIDLLYTKYMKGYTKYRDLLRIEEYVVHREMLRELLYNAVAHKDYKLQVPIQLRVFDDKIRIENMGTLPFGWTVSKLFTHHSSVPFNPLISKGFFYAGYVEAWGRGIAKVKRYAESENYPIPIFNQDLGYFETTLPGKPDIIEKYVKTERDVKLAGTSQHQPATSQRLPGITQHHPAPPSRQAEDDYQALPSTTKHYQALPSTLQIIMELINKNPEISLKELADKTKLTVDGVRFNIKKLTEDGYIVRTSKNQYGYYKVLK